MKKTRYLLLISCFLLAAGQPARAASASPDTELEARIEGIRGAICRQEETVRQLTQRLEELRSRRKELEDFLSRQKAAFEEQADGRRRREFCDRLQRLQRRKGSLANEARRLEAAIRREEKMIKGLEEAMQRLKQE